MKMKGLKRYFDVILSFIAIIILSIPMLMISLAIKKTSVGPVLFKQKRVGINGIHFEIYKFRTMCTDAPNISTEELGDPSGYITPIGKFLRKTSLDELPQLFNILIGNMSIVGPRPALYNQYELIEMRQVVGVNDVLPGLTGYAQVMGRDYISDIEKVGYDRYYVEHMNLLFDIKIIWLTLRSVLKADGVRLK